MIMKLISHYENLINTTDFGQYRKSL